MANKVVIDTEIRTTEVNKGLGSILEQIGNVIRAQEEMQRRFNEMNGMNVNVNVNQNTTTTTAPAPVVQPLPQIQPIVPPDAPEAVEVINEVEEASNKASEAIKRVGNSTKNTNFDISKGIKFFLKYALGIRSVYILINKIRRGILEGIKNLAQFNEGLNPTNEALSNLKSSLTQLKNTFATAFQPILQVVEPILTRLINGMSTALNTVSMFIARLKGGDTYTKAVKVNQNYAKSLSKVGQSAKEASKQLAGFYDLNVITTRQEEESADALSPNNMFEIAPIEANIASLADTFKEKLQPIRDFFNEEVKPRFFDTLGKGMEMASTLAGIVSPKLLEFYHRVLVPIGEYAGNTLLEFLDHAGTMFENLQTVFTEKGGKIQNILEAITKTAEFLWAYGFKPTLDFITGAFFSLMDNIHIIVGDIIDVFDGLADFLGGVFTGDWERAWLGIKKIFFGVWNGILDIYQIVVNGIIDGINHISITIPSWVPDVGGQTLGFNLERLDISKFKIPALATGTVIPRSSNEFLAKLGDNNEETEVVSPLSTMKQAFLEALQEGRGETAVNVYLEGEAKDIFRVVQKESKNYYSRYGNSAF